MGQLIKFEKMDLVLDNIITPRLNVLILIVVLWSGKSVVF